MKTYNKFRSHTASFFGYVLQVFLWSKKLKNGTKNCQRRVDITHPDAEGIGIFSIAIPAENEKGFQEVNVGEIIDE